MVSGCNMAMVFHGAIILLLSQLAGYAFFRAINKQSQERTAMWRMSHAASSAGAVFLIALGPVVPHLHLTRLTGPVLVASLIFSTYALCLGTVVAAASGARGTRPRLPWPNLLAYALYVVGALGSSVAGLVLLFAAAKPYFASNCEVGLCSSGDRIDVSAEIGDQPARRMEPLRGERP